MDFPLKIDGWEREVETELIDLFEWSSIYTLSLYQSQ